jgi:hypothetical protein
MVRVRGTRYGALIYMPADVVDLDLTEKGDMVEFLICHHLTAPSIEDPTLALLAIQAHSVLKFLPEDHPVMAQMGS